MALSPPPARQSEVCRPSSQFRPCHGRRKRQDRRLPRYIPPVPIDIQILERSFATPRFKADVIAFAKRTEAPSITLLRIGPRIKVIRLINQLLHAHPEWVVDSLRVEAYGSPYCHSLSSVCPSHCSGYNRRPAEGMSG